MQIEMRKLALLPPRKGLCPECAVEHSPEQPHNPQSLYYQMKFFMEHQRSPAWSDAMAHCSQDVKSQWLRYLRQLGVDPDSTNLTPKPQS